MKKFIIIVLILGVVGGWYTYKSYEAKKEEQKREELFSKIEASNDTYEAIQRDIINKNYALALKKIKYDTNMALDKKNDVYDYLIKSYMNYAFKIVNEEYNQDGDYIYMTGRLQNNGDLDISYFEITFDLTNDTGKVLDSTYTNSIHLLKAGTAQAFDTMQRMTYGVTKIKAYVSKFDFVQ